MQAIHEYQIHPAYGAARDKVRLYWSRRALNALTLAAGDLLALTLAFLIAGTLAGHALQTALPFWAPFVLAVWLCGAAFTRLLPNWSLPMPTVLQRLTELLLAVFGAAALVLLIMRRADEATVITLIWSLVLAWPLVIAAHLGVERMLRSVSAWGVPAVVFGAAQPDHSTVQALHEHTGHGYRPVAWLGEQDLTERALLGAAAQAPVAILAGPGLSRTRLVELLDGPLALYPKVVVVPDLSGVESMWVRAGDYGGMLGIELVRNLLDPLAAAAKRGFDLLVVLLSAPVWVSVCLLLAALIWLEDRANPLFLQRRVGQDGRPFMTWKFRTMLPNAEEVLRRTLERDPVLRAEWETHYKLKRDPRITRIGGLLRKTSLDEIPQLVNVLLGQMSMVGPRPLPAYHLQQLSPQTQRLRARVRPGLTGLWQVSGRSDAGNAGMERWDPYYVRNWSIWLDLVIVLRTVVVVLKGSGAY